MKIRKAKKSDFKEIARLIRTEYKKHYNENWTEENAIKTLKYYKKIAKIFIAEKEKGAIGFVIFREEHYNKSKSIMIEELIVDSRSQGKGIGREIMDFVEEYSRKNKANFIWLLASKKARAFRFYRNIGYKYNAGTAYLSKELK